MGRRARLLLLVLVAWLGAGCAMGRPFVDVRPPIDAGAFLVWEPATVVAGVGAGGQPLDVVEVRGGEIVRLELTRSDVRIGERVRGGSDAVDTWSLATAGERTTYVRATALAAALLVPKGTIIRAYVAHASEPGYYWFELEDRVLAWAAGPLGAPFPRVAPAPRIDTDRLMELDHVLEAAIASAGGAGREAALEEVLAIRRVAGLRAIRALRPPIGYPYFFDSAPSTTVAPRTDAAGHAWFEVSGAPLELGVDGPSILHLWTRAVQGARDEAIDLEVFEGDRRRAGVGGAIPRASADAAPSSDPKTLPLRRALVHVPPGHHSYRVEVRGGGALVYPLVAKPVVHVEDAFSGRKSEAVQLSRARAACVGGGVPALCMLALALAGDDGNSNADATILDFARARAASPPRARDLADALSSGGPRDPVLDLEQRAMRGDSVAIAKLSNLVESSSDEVTRSAWIQAVTRGTRWSVAHRTNGAERWMALGHDDGGSCADTSEAAWPEVTRDERSYVTTEWHGVPVVDLLVTSPSSDAPPVELVVDGARLIAQPSDAFSHWRVRVRGTSARVSLVSSGARVHAIPQELSGCAVRWEGIQAPEPASETPTIDFDPSVSAPGIEVWRREGAPRGPLTVSARRVADRAFEGVEIVVPEIAASAMLAIDPRGARWRRVARVALPRWARGGVSVQGGDGVAVRGIVRVARGADGGIPNPGAHDRPVARELEDETLIEMTRQLLATPPRDRGAKYAERAYYLAAGGAAHGALEDARAADALGTSAPDGKSTVAYVRTLLAVRQAGVQRLPDGIAAYGIDPEFDVDAEPGAASDGAPRARLARIADELAASAAHGDASKAGFSPALAARVIEAVQRAPLDPRGPGLVARALADSRWRLVAPPAGTKSMLLERAPQSHGPVDGEGELRPWIAAGAPFDEGSFATVVPGRPARAVIAAPRGTSARLDIVCVARGEAVAATSPCPLEVMLDGKLVAYPPIGLDGLTHVPLPLDLRRRALLVALASPHPGWLALVRVVFDHEVPGTRTTRANEWVLSPPHVEHRRRLEPGQAVVADFPRATVLRIEAQGADGPADVTVDVGGFVRAVPADGSPLVVPIPDGGRIALRANGRPAGIALAERVPREPLEPAAAEQGTPIPETSRPEASPAPSLDPRGDAAWRDQAIRSPRALSNVEASLGTAVFGAGTLYGTIHEGVPSLPASQGDGYAFLFADYRRRVESIGLWTAFGAYTNVREGESTYGASLVLYEELEKIHTRISGTVRVATQRIDGHPVEAIQPRGFVEYSWRATRDFFALPRLGFDGTYASLLRRPADLSAVDDNVFNPYRARRPTFLFAQVLLWYAPYFDDIFYLRNRVTYDPRGQDVSHVSMRPGLFVALEQLDVNGYLDAAWYSPSDSLRRESRLDELLGATLTYHRWSNMGSLDLQPGVAAFSKLHDGGYQVSVFLNLLTSYRRGLRDFSSLELDFPEQLGGGIPWRGATPGGYR